MKPEDAARERTQREYYDADSMTSEVANESFLAGYAHAVKELQSIWRKPEEGPELNQYIVTIIESRRWYEPVIEPHVIFTGEQHAMKWFKSKRRVLKWCYLSDFLKTLPSFATEEK